MNDRPTPETDARFRQAGMVKSSLADFARKLERERDEAREALSGRTVSCLQCNETAKQLAAMRDAIWEAHAAISAIHFPLGDETSTSGNPCVGPNPAQGRALAAALAKLQPFITP